MTDTDATVHHAPSKNDTLDELAARVRGYVRCDDYACVGCPARDLDADDSCADRADTALTTIIERAKEAETERDALAERLRHIPFLNERLGKAGFASWQHWARRMAVAPSERVMFLAENAADDLLASAQ